MNIYRRSNIYLKTHRSLIFRGGIGWKVKLTIWLNDQVIWIQPNKVNMNKLDCGRWNEWDALWNEGNKLKHDQWSVDWRKWDETWTKKCGLTELRWNMNNEVDNATSPSLSLTTSGSKINVRHSLFFMFLCLIKKWSELFVYRRIQFSNVRISERNLQQLLSRLDLELGGE